MSSILSYGFMVLVSILPFQFEVLAFLVLSSPIMDTNCLWCPRNHFLLRHIFIHLFFPEQTLVEHLLCMRGCIEMWHDDYTDSNI